MKKVIFFLTLFVLNTLYASNGLMDNETGIFKVVNEKGHVINKVVLNNNTLKVTIKKGLYFLENDKTYLVLSIKNKTKVEERIEFEKNIHNLPANGGKDLLVTELNLKFFLKNQFYKSEKKKLEDQHKVDINNIKKIAKTKIIEILDYSKKLEKNLILIKKKHKEEKTREYNETMTQFKKFKSLMQELQEKQKRSLVLSQNPKKNIKLLLEEMKVNINNVNEKEFDKSLLILTIEDMKLLF